MRGFGRVFSFQFSVFRKGGDAHSHVPTFPRFPVPPFPRSHVLTFLISCALLFCGGCRPAAPATPAGLTAEAERGPYKFTVEISPKEAWVGDAITIKLRATTPEGQVVELPGAGDFGGLTILNVEKNDPKPAIDGGLVWEQTVAATADVSGAVDMPALTMKYGAQPAQADSPPIFDSELAVDAQKIEVRSALTSQDSVSSPRDITGVLTPGRRPLTAWEWAGLVGGILLLGTLATLVTIWIRRVINRPPPPILPEVWALRQLSLLEAETLIAEWRPKGFYYGLSEIVRGYIEKKFRLAAPEMTTEEFLVALARDRRAVPYDAFTLREFMEACDLVKYAALEPVPADGQNALGRARSFVDATAAAAEATSAGPVAQGGQAA
jgi:hypothetical protein